MHLEWCKKSHPYYEIKVECERKKTSYTIMSTSGFALQEMPLEKIMLAYTKGYSLRFSQQKPQGFIIAKNLPYKSQQGTIYISESSALQFSPQSIIKEKKLEQILQQNYDVILINEQTFKPKIDVN